MIKIGITGGIGSGKSVVSECLRIMRIPVYNADEASRHILQTNSFIRDRLKNLLGPDIFSNGELNRAKMASLIFNDPGLLSQTNAIIHPAVFDDFNRWSDSRHSMIVACESAIVFESGMNRFLDFVITVSAPAKIRIERTKLRDSVTDEQVMNRIKNQLPDEQRTNLSDFVLVNDNRQAIIPQLHKILQEIKG
ncbi:MAG: dephospho-CoA kinase [Prevotellaceae bacterium]|jgi:dephospho-CoA kinase|nr:dephospho-CoA kinase [Prevotellaceae bacterium]